MDEREDYVDPPGSRTRASKLFISLLVLLALAGVATAAWIGLLMFCGDCSKYG